MKENMCAPKKGVRSSHCSHYSILSTEIQKYKTIVLHKIHHLPTQLFSPVSNVYPSLHSHEALPIVSTQVATASSQVIIRLTHSSTSDQ